MGKRKHGGLGGLSGFAAKVFGKGAGLENNDHHSTNDLPAPALANAAHPKRRKLDDSGSDESARERWVQKYDATGLVPHYRDLSEVPEHLQKCETSSSSDLALFAQHSRWTIAIHLEISTSG